MSDAKYFRADVLTHATHWVKVLHFSEEPVPFFDAYATWLNASPENNRAYLFVQDLWRSMEEASLLGLLP